MHGRRVRAGHSLVALARRGLGLAQRREPAVSRRRTGHGLRKLAERRLDVTEDRHLRGLVLAVVVDIDVKQARLVAEDRRLSEVEAEVEQHTDQEHQVGVAQCLAAGAGEEQRMRGGQRAACHPVHGQRQLRRLDDGPKLVLCVRPPHAAAGDDDRALGGADQAGGLLDEGMVWRRTRVGSEVLGRLREVGGAEEHIDRDVHEHRPRAPAERGAHALRGGSVCILRAEQRHRLLGQAARDLDVIHLLERAHSPSRDGRAAADDEERAVVAQGLRHRGRGVRDAGAGGHGGDAALACHLCPALGRERG